MALELARTFGRAGLDVFVADSQYNLTRASGFVRGHVRVPKPRLYPRAFAQSLAEIVRRERIELVIPTCEEIFWLASCITDPDHTDWRERVFAPPFEVLALLHHKMRFIELLESLKLRAPRTHPLESRQALQALPRDQRWVLKPAYSRFGAQTQVLEVGQTLPDVRITRAQPWLAQDFVPGEECCTFAVCSRGRVQAFALYRPGWRAGRSASVSFMRLETTDPRFTEALEITERICAALDFSGQIAFDLIANQSGLTVLECNPRATSGVHLFSPADHLERAYLGALETPILATGQAAKLGIPMLFYALPAVLKPDGRKLWLQTWNDSRDALRDPEDPLPLAHQARCVLENAREALRLNCSLLAATTADIEWNGEPLEPDGVARVELGVTVTNDPDRCWATAFLPELMRSHTKELAENLDCTITSLRVGRHLLPVTITKSQPGNAYVISSFTHYVSYALDELRELKNPPLEVALRWVLIGLGKLLKFGRADDAVLVDNALVSTNLHPHLSLAELRAATGALTKAYPDCAIGMRSVHGRDSRLPEYFRELGYKLIPARSVSFVPTADAEFKRKRDVRQDATLLRESGYLVRSVLQPSVAELERMCELYRLLYIQKYSRHNPRFTPAFLEMAARTGMLEFRALERGGRVDGVIGFFVRAGYLTVPILGYDTRLPKETGLYRMLSSMISAEAHARGVDLHASSGVAAFKRSRGGEPGLEYTAIYSAHLPIESRIVWAMLEHLIARIAVPLIAGRSL